MEIMLHKGDTATFEYTILMQVTHMGRGINYEQDALEVQRQDILAKITRRVNEFYDSIILMEQ